jgi:hypothetical protein
METSKIEILKGPSKEKMGRIYRTGSGKNVCFEVNYIISRTAFINILEIMSVQEISVKMLASMPAGFFMYSQGEDSKPDSEKLQHIQVYLFYTTNTRKGYIEKIPKKEIVKNQEPRICPRCNGEKFDPYHYQDDCQRCGGVGEVYSPESNFKPPGFVD